MKKLGYLFCFVLIIFQACNDDITESDGDKDIATCEECNFNCLDSNDTDVITNADIDNWEGTFQVTAASKVDLNEHEGKGAGNKNVFQMIRSTEGSSMIADDEFTNILVLELAATQNSFAVEGSELADMNVNFRRICFCSETEFKAITSGCLQGEKQDNGTWFVQGNLVVPYSWGNFEVKFEAQFVN